MALLISPIRELMLPPSKPRLGERLPPRPNPKLEQVSLDPAAAPGFLRLIRRHLIAHFPDGSQSEPFAYDEVGRPALDAVVVAPHYLDGNTRRVFLRSCVRPPIVFRDRSRSPQYEPEARGLWELPAGLVEPDEYSPAGLQAAAARELAEELGFNYPAARFEPLGPSSYPAPGIIAERHYYFHIEINPAERAEPTSDGSALEAHGSVIDVALEDALDACLHGEIEDAKTELALRRLADLQRRFVKGASRP